MCTRFFTKLIPELVMLVEAAKRSWLWVPMQQQLDRPMTLLGEIRPTDGAAVLAPNKDGKCSVYPMIWGFRIDGKPSPVINARIETAAAKPLFREPWACRRCIIPAVNYFEWQHLDTPGGKKTGDKFAIKPAGSALTYLAGLYRFEERQGLRYPVFTVLTKEPTEQLRTIHDRMPVMLPASAVNSWLDPAGDPQEISKLALTEMEIRKAE